MIYQKHQRVFTDDISLENNFVQFRITWTTADIVSTIPITLAAGQTVLASISIDPEDINTPPVVQFYGKHPTKDIVYGKQLQLANDYNRFIVTPGEVFAVTPDAGATYQIFRVPRLVPATQESLFVLKGGGIYLLLNLNGIVGLTWDTPAPIEPYHVVFDTIQTNPVFVLDDGATSVPFAGNAFSNTPDTGVCACEFFAENGLLRIKARGGSITVDTHTYVKYINGAPAVNKNFNVELLNG